VADLFDMQDEIVAWLANQLGAQLVAAEARRAEHVPHPDSMDLYFRGRACLHDGGTAEHMAKASGFFERALMLDPANVGALVGAGFVDFYRAANLFADDGPALLGAAEATLTKALSLSPRHAWAHERLGHVLIHTNRATQGIAECERALALDRNLAGAHAIIGVGKLFLGRAEETEAHVKEALRLSPRDTLAHMWLAIAGFAKFFVRRDDEAVTLFRRSIETNRNYPQAHFWLAAALAQLGRLNEARSAVASGLALDRTFTIRRYRTAVRSDDPAVRAQGRRLIEGMRKAGVPEG
jgi:tetratricopeptide (TPR) repeat protein